MHLVADNPSSVGAERFNEAPIDTPLVFGEYQNLVGVTCEPSCPTDHIEPTAVVMVTPGMLHHVGPFRLHVHLARNLAHDGYVSMRFDLSGIGESLAVGASGNSLDRAASEIKQAMNALEERFGTRQFVLFGLCSGADDSVHTALTDGRVKGLVLMDGCGYRTWGYWLHKLGRHWPKRLLSPSKWQAAWQPRTTTDAPVTLQIGDDIREFPPQQTAARQFRTLIDRGVNLKFIYTGGVAQYYNHAHQFWAMFPELRGKSQIDVEYLEPLDHVALLCEDRRLLLDKIRLWVKQTNWLP